MIIPALLLAKIIITTIIVLILLFLAEKISPQVSGIISGVPTGTAIILFFYALEQGTRFVLQSSLFNLVGMVAIHAFIYFYLIFSNKNKLSNIIFSSLMGLAAYFLTISVLKRFEYSLFSAIILPLGSILFFNHLFRKIKDLSIKNNIKIGPKIIFIRVIVASLAIIVITSVAEAVGPGWAGLLSAFLTTIFPLLVIVHSTYGKEQVHTIIRNIPKGQVAVIIYVLSIIFLYPRVGVYLGTLISYLFVFVYLLLLFRYTKMTN